ncbi:MAG: hypothetical protein ACRCVW_04925 [Brevinema sp.]
MRYIKIFAVLSLMYLPIFGSNQSTTLSNIVTGLEFMQIESNIISVQWKSDVPSGTFSLYYNRSNPILTDNDLKVSELAIQTNLQGEKISSIYSYKLELMLADKGQYYFAVLIEPGFDDVARGLVDLAPRRSQLIPSLNSLLQPINIIDLPIKKVQHIEKQSYFLNNGYVITSLKLEKEKDFFRLRWFVFPKDLDQYVFIIYRSRYPIVNYTKPDGLPEYARVTNSFYFEDKNISMETPYYYAVVPEENKQWQRNLNVLEQPGVLMKNSPLFEIKPTVEYVKRKEQFPTKRNFADFSEQEIQMAVQQTLSNLEILPTYRTNKMPPVKDNVLESPLTQEEASNLNILNTADNVNVVVSNISELSNVSDSSSQEKSTPKLGMSTVEKDIAQFLEETRQQLFVIRDHTLQKQAQAEQKFLSNENHHHYYQEIMQEINDLSNEIVSHRRMEDKLLLAYKTPKDLLKARISEYYNHLNLINVRQFNIKSQIKSEYHKRKNRENQLLDQLNTIVRLEKEELDVFLKNRIFNYQRKINLYKENLDQLKSASIANSLVDRFHNTDPYKIENKNFGVFRPELSFQSKKEDSVFVGELAYKQINDFSWTNNLFEQLPPMISSEERVKKLQAYYNEISEEKIPTLEELPAEKWISQKEIWKRTHRELWAEQNTVWREKIAQIIGRERYDVLRNKWLRVSPEVAIKESAKAFNDARYDEALFLHSFIPNDSASILLLGRSYFELKAYQDAYSVFIVAFKMGIPESKYWLDLTAEKLINRNLTQD